MNKDNDYKDLDNYVMNTFNELKRRRRVIEAIWEDVTKYLLPRFAGWDFNDDDMADYAKDIFDGAAIAAHNRLADGIFGWLVSPTIPWLEFEPEDLRDRDDKVLMQYLQSIAEHLYDVFSRSNFYDAMAEDLHTSSGLGTSVMLIEDAREFGRPIYTPLHPREAYIDENRWHEVDTLYRKYKITGRQLIEEFGDGYDNEKQKKEIASQQKMVIMLHAVYPNQDFVDDGGLKLGENKKYKSVHRILEGAEPPKGQKHSILKVSGMDNRNFEAHRFNRASGMVYGISPAIDALPDIKMINMQAKTMADVSQLAARPPMQTTEMMKGRVRIAPGGMTYGMDPVSPIMTSFSYPIGLDAMTRREAVIREHFKTEFFQSISQLQQSSRDRTATEIMEIKAEAAAVMGSIVGRVQSERLEPMVRMTLLIEMEAGRLPPAPQGLDPKKAFKLKFVGPLAQSQKKYLRVQGISQGLGQAVQFAMTMQRPDTLVNFDMNWSMRELAVANGFPAAGLVALKDVQKIQQQQAQQQQQMMMDQAQNEKIKAMGQGGAAIEKGSAAAMAFGG